MKKVISFIFLLCYTTTIYCQQKIVVVDESKVLNIGKSTYLLEDETHQLSIQDILNPTHQAKFRLLDSEVFNRSATSTAFWFKIIVKNHTNKEIWLKAGDSFSTWLLDFYAPDSQGKYSKPILSGALRPQQVNALPSNFYCLPLTQGNDSTTKVYYFRIAGKTPKTHLFQIGTTIALSQALQWYDYSVAMFIGLIVAMFLYNAFLFYSVRYKIYLIYMGYLIWVVCAITFTNGYALIYKNWIWEYFLAWNGSGYLFITLFAMVYLRLPQIAPKLTRWIWLVTSVLSVIFPILNLSYLIHPIFLIDPYQIILLIYYLSLLTAGIVVWYKGHKNARFYILAWGFVILSTFLFVLTINGFLPYNIFTYNSMYIGFSLEALFFALALGDRLNTLKKQKEEAQAHNLTLVQEQNEQLEQKVKTRTLALQKSQDEILTQNEELRQTQEELEAQRDFLDHQNSQLNIQNKKVHSSIKAAQSIQQAVLPPQKKLNDLLQNYFVINRPKDVVSGDFYWLNEINQEIILAVADCTGHGVPGAFMTLIGSSLLDKIIYQDQVTNPSHILDQLHQELNIKLQDDDAMRSNGMDIVILNLKKTPQSTSIEFSGAKNSLFFIDTANFELREIKGTKKSIGGIQNEDKKFELHTLTLSPNSLIYLGSDGLMDQNDVKRKKFSKTRLKNTLQENAHLPLATQKTALEQVIDEYMQATEQRDDMLWFGIQV